MSLSILVVVSKYVMSRNAVSGRHSRAPVRLAACLLAIVAVAPSPRDAAACACCADPGVWHQTARRVTPEELSEIGRMNLGPVAKVYVTPAGLEEVQGIRSATAAYALRHLRPNRQWRLELQNETGQRGTLTFIIPDRGTFFAVGPQDGIEDPAGGPVLYKELRLSGPVSATGPFKGGTFSLVFQGRGNSCPDAAQFTSWILRVEGPGAAYALFGRADPPTPRPGIQGRAGDLYFPSPEAAVTTLTDPPIHPSTAKI